MAESGKLGKSVCPENREVTIQETKRVFGEVEFYNRVSGELNHERPPEYVTPRNGPKKRKTALELLNERLAGGEDEPQAYRTR